jgi:hypothetical protein
MSFTSGNMTKSAFSMLDMMMNMQRLGLQAVSAYQPLVSFLDSTSAAERATRPRFDAQRGRPSGLRELHDNLNTKVSIVPVTPGRVGDREMGMSLSYSARFLSNRWGPPHQSCRDC